MKSRKTPNLLPYTYARDAYAAQGVDTEKAIKAALEIPVSLHCWQADDVRGLETRDKAVSGGGILATGAYPGSSRNGDEMRQDLEKVLGLLPGVHRLNLHALYAETGSKKVERNALEAKHFSRWQDWASQQRVSLDFNPSYFAHPKADSGATLSHADQGIRDFWIEHGIASRQIAAAFAARQGNSCVNNHWLPDGAKDQVADRWSPRERLRTSLDAIMDARVEGAAGCLDAVEGKLFGIGSEEYVVGSHEFYSCYALGRQLMLCLDLGHFHPTESVADKVSSLLQFHQRLLLHTSRPVRWDSDHVVVLDDAVRQLFLEVERGKAWQRVSVALDYFDASINRLAAYVVGARATRQAILLALLDPTERIQAADAAGKGHERLALQENAKTLPWGIVWDELCRRSEVPEGASWLPEIRRYETAVLSKRG